MRVFSGVKRQQIYNLGLFSISLIPIVLYLYVVYQRIALPFDLEWGEGAGISQIYRMMTGTPLYAAPTIEFAPLVYTPFYYWLSSLLSGIIPRAALAARLISVVSSLAAAGLIGSLISKETGNRLAGWLAGAVYLACFALSDGFYDLVRVDSLYVFLLLAAFYTLRASKTPAAMAAAGLLVVLGFYTKQSALIVFSPLLVFLIGKRAKTAWPLIAVVILGILVPFLLINSQSEGWFSYYILRLPREHGYSMISAVDFWVGDLLGPLGIAFVFGLLFLVFQFAGSPLRFNLDSKRLVGRAGGRSSAGGAVDYLLFAAGAIGAAWITRSSNGGGANNVMSAYAVIALFTGLGFSSMLEFSKRTPEQGGNFRLIAYGMAAFQLLGLLYNPFNFIPTPAEVDANDSLVARIEESAGPVWIPYRSHLPSLAGKESFIHAVNLFEFTGYFKGDVLPEGRALVGQLQEEICGQSFGMIILDQDLAWIERELASAYQAEDLLLIPEGSRRSTQLRWQGGFEAIYVPREGYDLQGCLEGIEEYEEGQIR